MFVGLLATVMVARGAISSIVEPVVVEQRMRDARDRHPPHLGVLQNPVFATSAHNFLPGFASWDLGRRGAELEKAHLYPRFALSTRLEGSGRNGARGVKTANGTEVCWVLRSNHNLRQTQILK